MKFLVLLLCISCTASLRIRPAARIKPLILSAIRRESPGEISDVPTSINTKTIKEITKIVINLTILYVTINMKVQEVLGLGALTFSLTHPNIHSLATYSFYTRSN